MTVEELWNNRMSKAAEAEGYVYREISPPRPDVPTVEQCRKLCAQNLCGFYDSNWGCPPGVGSIGDVRRALALYPHTAVVYKRTEIDHNEKEGLKRLSNDHQNLLRSFNNVLRESGYRSLPLADGGCNYCTECSYPNEKCRFPEQRVASVSGYGIKMMEYLETFGIEFRFEEKAVTMYGLVLYDDPKTEPQ